MLKRRLLTIMYITTPIIPCVAIYLSNSKKYCNILTATTTMTGAISYAWIMVQLIASSRPKFLIKYFWDDEYYKYHGIMGIAAIAVSTLHGGLEFYMGRRTRPISILGYGVIFVFIVICIISVLFMSEKGLGTPSIIKNIENIKFGKYEYQLIIHKITLIASVALFIHVMLCKAKMSVKYVYIAYFIVASLFYINYIFKKWKKLQNDT